MNHARSNDDAVLDRLRAGTGSDVEDDPRLPLVRALVRIASEPPPPAVEQRHLAAISAATRALGDGDPRQASNGRPTAGERLARGVRGIRLARPLKLAALVVATALALTGVVFASSGLPAPLREALEDVGLLPEETGDDSRGVPRLPVGTASRRGPMSRCARAGEASPSATPAWCRPPRRGGKGEPAQSRGRARRSARGGRARSREPGARRRESPRGGSEALRDSPPARRGSGDSAPGRSGSSPSRRGYAPAGGGRGRSSGGRPAGSGRGRSSSAPRGRGRSRGRGPALRER